MGGLRRQHSDHKMVKNYQYGIWMKGMSHKRAHPGDRGGTSIDTSTAN
uniref:Uncharacterized protein n=1 Tax=Arundo donax TaxID=35708 RepID=A0A0A8YEQ5_ARUDO